MLEGTVRDAGFNVLKHCSYEFPLDRLRESQVILMGLRALYAVQALLGHKTEQYLLASRPT